MQRARILCRGLHGSMLRASPSTHLLLFAHQISVRGKATASKQSRKGQVQPHRLPSINLSAPEQLYSKARSMKRRLVCHVGPTNSGKTFRALEALKSAKSGVYLGPLRLLAWEVSEKLNDLGVACNLVTGQELLEVAGANHTSCTVEMANLSQPFDVAVIDEAQLIGDDKRGWAWARALLGLQAREIHVCGSPSFLDLVTKLAKRLGDTIEVFEYDRLTPLHPEDAPLMNYKRLKAGDCVIAFSRRNCYDLKQRIEKLHKGRYKCCVVYGGLPPAARQEQAKLFNTQNSGYDILVATDAVGMGLNLSIGRIIFSSLEKFDGKKTRTLRVDEIKQIGGRAGRYQSMYPTGKVVCLKEEDVNTLKRGLRARDKRIPSAGLFPSVDELRTIEAFVKYRVDDDMLDAFYDWMGTSDLASIEDLRDCLEDFVAAHPKHAARLQKMRARKANRQRLDEEGDADATDDVPLSKLFQLFAELAMLDGSGLYHLCDLQEVIEVAKCLDGVPLEFEDRYQWCMAPINVDCSLTRRHFIRFARKFAAGDNVFVGLRLPDDIPTNHAELLELESRFQVFDLYTWLANRYPVQFEEKERAMELRQQCSEIIAAVLMKLGPKPPALKANRLRSGTRAPLGEGYDNDDDGDDYFDDHDELDDTEGLEDFEGNSDEEDDAYDDEGDLENSHLQRDNDTKKGRSRRSAPSKSRRTRDVHRILREIAAV